MVPTAGALPIEPPIEATEPPDAFEPGAKAGPWVVERELGRGGMGAVYAVVHEEIGKRAALKVMHRRLTIGSSSERILLEAKVVNQVGHPNIVDIFETGTMADGRPYIVMERLEGVALSERADQGKILPDQVISILLQVCDALIAAHAAGIVHRDLKLDNVFLIDNPDDPLQAKVKLLDWGIAKVIRVDRELRVDREQGTPSAGGPHNTIEGQLVGTPQYLAPEQARGAAVSPQTDVYSLGVMAYELFLEQLPFEAETSAEIMAMHLRAVPPPPSELWPDVPPALEQLLLAMLAKDPEARPSMLTVARTLELLREELERRRTSAGATPTMVARRRTSAPDLAVPDVAQRWISAPGLAPTEPAMWKETSRRWQVVVGAFALAASAAMLLVSRVHDSVAASAPPPPPPPLAIKAEPLAAHIAMPDPHAEVVDAAIVMDPAPSPTPVHKRAKRHIAPRGASRITTKAPVMPHRGPMDPDGTLDPYQ